MIIELNRGTPAPYAYPFRATARHKRDYNEIDHRREPKVRIRLPPAERWYGAGGEGDGTIVAGK